MSTQPEALRLADLLQEQVDVDGHWSREQIDKAAAELRRLHAANIDCVDHFNAIKAERDELAQVAKAEERESIAKFIERIDLSGIRDDLYLQKYTAVMLSEICAAIRRGVS